MTGNYGVTDATDRVGNVLTQHTYRSFVQAADHSAKLDTKLTAAGAVAGLDVALKFLALPYVDHPDYREEWRPTA